MAAAASFQLRLAGGTQRAAVVGGPSPVSHTTDDENATLAIFTPSFFISLSKRLSVFTDGRKQKSVL